MNAERDKLVVEIKFCKKMMSAIEYAVFNLVVAHSESVRQKPTKIAQRVTYTAPLSRDKTNESSPLTAFVTAQRS